MKKLGAPFGEKKRAKLKDPCFAKAYHEELQKLRVAHQIVEIREEMGITQSELARRLGTTQSGVARMEAQGYMGYSIRTLLKVADVLDVELVIRLRPKKKVA